MWDDTVGEINKHNNETALKIGAIRLKPEFKEFNIADMYDPNLGTKNCDDCVEHKGDGNGEF